MAAAAEPIARRTASGASTVSVPAPLRHPTPDLQSLQGAYTKNIAMLERSAEEMSQGGSDIGEEIRKLNELSRQNSIQSSHHGDISVVRPSVMERMGSTRSSRAGSNGRSIKDVNGAARWGGYSPGGYVTSPVGSTSGSWSHASLSRVTSGSKSSRLAQYTEPMREGRPLDSPLRPSLSIHETQNDQDAAQEHSRDVSQSSFAQRYDEIAGQIEDSLEHVPPSPTKDSTPLHRREPSERLAVEGVGTPERPRSADTMQEAQIAFKDFDGVHFNPETEELIEMDPYGNEIRRVSARTSSGALSIEAASLLRTPRARPMSQVAPPPDESMVYYPAPVPRVLNLPKRLSQLPAASVHAKRRSQVLSGLPPDALAGVPWLSQENSNDEGLPRRSAHHSRGSGSSSTLPKAFLDERMSANLSNLPPQLRADMFFEHRPISQDVEVQSGSAVATLDHILAASATAPVNAFTDHPYAGDVRRSVYSPEHRPRKSTTTVSSLSPESKKTKKRRSSSFGTLLKRTTSNDEVTGQLKKRGSRSSMLIDLDFNEGGKKLQKRKSMMSLAGKSQLSLGGELEREDEFVQTPGAEIEEPHTPGFDSGLIASAQNASPQDERRASRAPTAMSTQRFDDDEQIEDDFKEEDAQEDVEDDELRFVQPSTLLAELQVRKAQQKSRNKTAATAFPRGMHSTLLEMDAVEEINKRKRKQQRITLAWEDPHQRALDADLDANDEDVPLGMLFPTKEGRSHRKVGDGKDWDRRLGLMERRELEDNEPLSSRRHRLRGGSPTRGRAPSPEKNGSQMHLPAQTDAVGNWEEENGQEGETLGQRMRRMKSTDALDGAISDVAPREGIDRPVSTFTDDVLSQFSGLDIKDKDNEASPGAQKNTGSPLAPEEEETLGQRRARLQREREASGEQHNISDGSTRPPALRSSSSLAILLSANPVGQRVASKQYQPTQGTLLHANAKMEAKQKQQLVSTNLRSSSYYLDKPLVNAQPQISREPNTGSLMALQQHNSFSPSGGFAAGTYNNGMGGIQLQTAASTPMLGNGYFASPTMGYGGGMMAYPQMQMQAPPVYQPTNSMMFNSAGMMGNGYMGNAYNPGMMGGTYAAYAQNMGMDAADLNPNQRAAIDRWRLGVAHQ